MNFGRIRGVNKPVSRILLGTAVSPMLLGQDADEMLDAAFESGINAFDTARNYGGAERSLGRWLKARGVRKDAVILSKCGHPDGNGSRVNERAIRDDLSRSLEALQTDFIDIYLLHRDDKRVPVGEIVELLNALHNEGKIGAFGGSNWTHGRIAAANDYAREHGLTPFAVSSPNFSLGVSAVRPVGRRLCDHHGRGERGGSGHGIRRHSCRLLPILRLREGFSRENSAPTSEKRRGKCSMRSRSRRMTARKTISAYSARNISPERRTAPSRRSPCGGSSRRVSTCLRR